MSGLVAGPLPRRHPFHARVHLAWSDPQQCSAFHAVCEEAWAVGPAPDVPEYGIDPRRTEEQQHSRIKEAESANPNIARLSTATRPKGTELRLANGTALSTELTATVAEAIAVVVNDCATEGPRDHEVTPRTLR